MKNTIKRLIILSSGLGSNLQSIINTVHNHNNIIISAVVSDHPSISIKRAIKANIPCFFLPANQKNQSNIHYDQILNKFIQLFSPYLIILSGFMRILSKDFIENYPNQIINIHPSLLPKYKGLNTHKRVLNKGEKIHGTTIHYVNEYCDSGPIIAQKSIEVSQDDTIKSLEKKIKHIEHKFYPEIIKKLCQDKK